MSELPKPSKALMPQTERYPTTPPPPHTPPTGIVATLSVKAGIVLKGLREPGCLLHVRLITGVVLARRVG